MSATQYSEAERLLPIIASATESHRLLTYKSAARELGRDPEKNARMVAQVCDLLDAAAAFAGVPLVALVMVRTASGDINPKAWAGDEHRDAIIQQSLQHTFTVEDFKAIADALKGLEGISNLAAWRRFREGRTSGDIILQNISQSDAINDLGTDDPPSTTRSYTSYSRDPKIRIAVIRRAKGKCEFCKRSGFRTSRGDLYLESHHIIALANDGADRMTNVIALCPEHHREAHYGERRAELEKEMIQIVKDAETSE